MKRNALITFVSAVVIRVALLVVFFSFKNRQSATVDPGRRSGLHGVQMPAVVRRDIPASVEKSVERGKLGVEILKFPDAEEIEMRFRNPEPFGRGEYLPERLVEGYAELLHRDFDASITHLIPHERDAGTQRAKEILRQYPACFRSSGYYQLSSEKRTNSRGLAY